MTTKTHTIHRSEKNAVDGLVTAVASLQLVTPEGPIQPTQIRKLSGGWVGAEWVRYVADYQDAESVGYASLGDLAADHEWSDDVDPDFEPVERYSLTDLVAKTHALLADDGFSRDSVVALIDGSSLKGLPADIDAAAAELARDFRAAGAGR